MQPDKLVLKLKELCKTSEHKALDFLYNIVDDMLWDAEFELIDRFVSMVHPKDLPDVISVGILVLTYSEKSRIQSREVFIEQFKSKLKIEVDESEYKDIMKGLE